MVLKLTTILLFVFINTCFGQSSLFNQCLNLTKSTNWDSIPLITIKVIVHIAWNKEKENLDNLIIENSIKNLSNDFRNSNQDKLNQNHPFYKYAADTKIDFKLILIQRVFTDSTSFSNHFNARKLTYMHGHSGDFYYNIFVGNFGGQASAVSPFRKHLLINTPDGISIDYIYFNKEYCNRILTEETGHWLGLEHTFGASGTNLTETLNGDYGCGNDYVDDTPPQTYPSYGIPQFPHDAFNICGSDENGVMFMNYMDYSHPCVKCMFTIGQAIRMRAVLISYRKNLIISK